MKKAKTRTTCRTRQKARWGGVGVGVLYYIQSISMGLRHIPTFNLSRSNKSTANVVNATMMKTCIYRISAAHLCLHCFLCLWSISSLAPLLNEELNSFFLSGEPKDVFASIAVILKGYWSEMLTLFPYPQILPSLLSVPAFFLFYFKFPTSAFCSFSNKIPAFTFSTEWHYHNTPSETV